MKKQTLLYFLSAVLIISICFIAGCSKTISVCTESLPTTVSLGATVLFSGCGSADGTYSWNFGDGSTASGDSVMHTYATLGTYNASVTEHSGNNTSGTKNFTVNVINDSWQFRGTIFGADSVGTSATSSVGLIYAYGINGKDTMSLDFVFQALPTASGSYTVVNAANGVVAGSQVYITIYADSAGTRKIYGSTGSGNISAQITVTGGQISASLPAIEVVNESNASDSTTFSANITQLP